LGDPPATVPVPDTAVIESPTRNPAVEVRLIRSAVHIPVSTKTIFCTVAVVPKTATGTLLAAKIFPTGSSAIDLKPDKVAVDVCALTLTIDERLAKSLTTDAT
jgi:hypothetical protein